MKWKTQIISALIHAAVLLACFGVLFVLVRLTEPENNRQGGGAGQENGKGKTGKRKLRQSRNEGRRALRKRRTGRSHRRSISQKATGMPAGKRFWRTSGRLPRKNPMCLPR